MSLARAIFDINRFSQKEFSTLITFTDRDFNTTVTVRGLISKHNLSIDPDTGRPVSSKNVHLSIAEKVLIDAGYETRNYKNEIDIKWHMATFSDASGSSFSYYINTFMPSETTGLIVCILGESNEIN